MRKVYYVEEKKKVCCTKRIISNQGVTVGNKRPQKYNQDSTDAGSGR
jgi:hypothetical protein